MFAVSIHPFRPLAIPFRALDVIARTRYENVGGQQLIVPAIPGMSKERCCTTTRMEVVDAPHVPVSFVRRSNVSWEREDLM